MNTTSLHTHVGANLRAHVPTQDTRRRSAAWHEGLQARLAALVRRLPAWQRHPLSPADDAARDAAAVRALADRYRRSDPGFASDLCAAADRAEQEQVIEAARIAAAHSN